MCQSKAAGGKRCALHQRGSRAMLAVVRAGRDLDSEQGDAVFRKAHRQARPRKNAPTAAEWEAFLDDKIERLALDMSVDPNDFDRLARQLHAAKAEVPDARTYAALGDLDVRADKAVRAIRRQINGAAAFRGADPDAVAERFRAYRTQYRLQLRRLPKADRPAPPEEWIHGFTTKDMMAVSAPSDPATLYAIYRCQADPDAFPNTSAHAYASIDLETAGPDGKAGFNPENGSIIEVGVVEYDAAGNETGRYSQLIAPHPDVAEQCGTGAVAIHGITMDDVADAPAWAEVAPTVAERLNGRVLLAQNARFEQDWLNHHMGAQGQDFDRWGPTVDTMCIAKQHLPGLANHRLSTICAAVGVEYTDGHRALHDADVAGQAFFSLRRKVTETYRADPVRAAAPQPPAGAGLTGRRRSQVTRLSAGDFTPSHVVDPWTVVPGDRVGVA